MGKRSPGCCSGYRWVIFGVCFLWEMVFMSLTLADSVYVVPVTQSLGFTRGQFTLVFSIRSVVQLLGSLAYGRLYDRLGVNPLIGIGTLCMVGGYLLYASASKLWGFYLAAAIVGIATAFMSASSLTIVLNSWFDRSAGLVFGIVFTGSSLGGCVISSLVGRILSQVGYVQSYRLTALTAALSALPVLLLAREKPATPYQETAETSEKGWAHGASKSLVLAGLGLCFAIGLTVYPIEASICAHLTDRGFSSEFAAGILGAALLCSAVGKVALGGIYDRWGLNAMVLSGAGCFLAGAAQFLRVRTPGEAWALALIFGLAIANITTVSPFLTKGIFSPRDYGRYIGLFTAVTAAGNTVGFTAMNAVFDISGSYTLTVLIQMGIFAVSALVFCRCYAQNTEGEARYD